MGKQSYPLGSTNTNLGYLGSYGTTLHLGQSRYIVGDRNYLGEIGRFISTDDFPADYSSTQSREFSMASNSPANQVDYTGFLSKYVQKAPTFEVPESGYITRSAYASNFVPGNYPLPKEPQGIEFFKA